MFAIRTDGFSYYNVTGTNANVTKITAVDFRNVTFADGGRAARWNR